MWVDKAWKSRYSKVQFSISLQFGVLPTVPVDVVATYVCGASRYTLISAAVLSVPQVQTAYILGIPVIATEQYPKGLGNTVTEIDVSKAKVFAKTKFSMIIPEVEQILKSEDERKSVILTGIEVSNLSTPPSISCAPPSIPIMPLPPFPVPLPPFPVPLPPFPVPLPLYRPRCVSSRQPLIFLKEATMSTLLLMQFPHAARLTECLPLR